jgi:predicted anti-sigma-YlaC factor YlaD
MTEPKLTCHDVSRILSDGLDKEMTAPERARLRLHLVICDACRQVEQQMAFMRRALHRLGSEDKDRDPRG